MLPPTVFSRRAMALSRPSRPSTVSRRSIPQPCWPCGPPWSASLRVERRPDGEERLRFRYPELRLTHDPSGRPPPSSRRAWAKFQSPGSLRQSR